MKRKLTQKSIRQLLLALDALRERPMTSTELAFCIDEQVSTVSSVVNRMVKRGEMKVIPNHGPRSGNGYMLNT